MSTNLSLQLIEMLNNTIVLEAYQLIPSPLVILTSNLEILFANKAFFELTGFETHEKNILNKLIKLDTLETFKKSIQINNNISLELNTCSNKLIKTEIKVKPICHIEGEIEAYLLSFHLISDSINEFEQLGNTKLEERYFSIFNKLPQPVVVFDLNSVIVDANLEALKVLGYDYKTLIGLSIEEIVNREYDNDIDQQLAQALQSKELFFSPQLRTIKGDRIAIEPKTFFITPKDQELFVSLLRISVEDKNNKKQLINAIIDTELNERKRFAKDLHDGLGPLLSTIKLYVYELKNKKIKVADREEVVLMITNLIDDAINNARETANNLMPTVIKNYGLVSAVHSFIEKINHLKKYKITFIAQPANLRLDNALETSFFRIIKELINNTIKHANAKNIDIKLQLNNNLLSLYFIDNGVGFDLERVEKSTTVGLGLNSIINRIGLLNGQINMKTSIGSGFNVDILIDLDKMFS